MLLKIIMFIDNTESDGVHFNSEGDIIVLDAYEWEIKKWRIPILKFA